MADKTLAVKYRPSTFDDMTEQQAIKVILGQQLATGTIKNCYLFCGPAGCGKTTSARIFANEINKGEGNPIEMDAASNSGVDDVKEILKQAKTKSLDSEYKVFIIDECHSISNTGWQAFLKLIEEPPAKSIFIFCTTDPQKIPKTILSRVQRYDFQRISHDGITYRLKWIIQQEFGKIEDIAEMEAIDYIAKIADGGMRDAITLMEKCLAYSTYLTLQNVVSALGTTDYDTFFKLTDNILNKDKKAIINVIESVYSTGKDLKQFTRLYLEFVLDLNKYFMTKDFKYIKIPKIDEYVEWLNDCSEYEVEILIDLLDTLIELNSNIKWDSSPKSTIQATLLIKVGA